MHRRKTVRFQFRSRREQFGEGLFVPIEQMIGGRLFGRVTHDDPAPAIVGLALHVEGMTGQARLD
jgi:hypothetical protein